MTLTRTLAILMTALIALSPGAFAQEGEGMQMPMDEESGYDGGTVDVVLYGHVFDLLNKVPVNTQPPIDLDLARGFGSPTAEPHWGSEFNELYLFSSPGPVHYNVSTKSPKIHPERGLAEDLQLDQSKEVIAYWYMSADALESSATGEPPMSAGAIPHLTVRATMRLGDNVGADLDAGQLVAQGETTMDVITAPGGNQTVYEFKINMGTPQMSSIPKDESFNIKFEWFQVDQSGNKIMSRDWNLHTGSEYPNRVVLPVKNPIRINYVHPMFVGDKLAIHTAFNSPFGNYDVDLSKLKLNIDGPEGAPEATSILDPIIVQKAWIHNHHFEPVQVTWIWDYKADGATPGEYTVSVEAANAQGNAFATKTAGFTIEAGGKAGQAISSGGEVTKASTDDGGEKDTPAPGVAALLAVAALASLALPRRRW